MNKYFEAIQDLNEAEKWVPLLDKSTICDLCRVKAKYYLELGNAQGFADEIMKMASIETKNTSYKQVGDYFEVYPISLTDRESRNKIRQFFISVFAKNVIAYSQDDKLYYKFENADANSTQNYCFADTCWETMDSETCSIRCEEFSYIASAMALFIPNKLYAAAVILAIGHVTIECKQCCKHGLGSDKCLGLIKKILINSVPSPELFSDDYL